MANPYETPRLVSEYLLFHYGRAEEILPEDAPAGMREALEFPRRTVGWFSPGNVARSLDLGCATGRSTYEMSRSSERTIGIDFSRAFVDAARAIGSAPLAFERIDEGNLRTRMHASLPAGFSGGEVSFETGDAMNLRADLGDFDRVHASNLLCRLPEPLRLLRCFESLVRRGGELLLATPCTWLEEFTPAAHWPPGTTLDLLKAELFPAFDLVRTGDEPFLIRETARKFQWTRSQVSLWRRRGGPEETGNRLE